MSRDFHQDLLTQSYDVVLAQLLLVEITSELALKNLLKEQFDALKPGGVLILTTTSEDFLRHRWTNIDTNFQGNNTVANGQAGRIRLINRNLVLDSYCWSKAFLLSIFSKYGFELLNLHQPLGSDDDPYHWQDELKHSPYNIFILQSI